MREVYVRSEEERREGDRADPDGGGEEDVQQHESPGKMGAPLQLPQTHLDEEQDEDADAEREEPRSVFP